MSSALPDRPPTPSASRIDATLLATVLAGVLLLGVAASSLVQLRQSSDESAWAAHARQVLDELTEAKARVKALESPALGPVIAADPPKISLLDSSAGALRKLTADNPDQQRRLDRLGPALERLHTAPTLADATFVASTLDEMQTHERALLAGRRARAKSANERAELLVVVGNALAFALVGYSVWRSRREIRARELAQDLADEQRRAAEDLYNQAPCGYHVSRSPDLVYDRVNDTELAWLGRSREELIGKKRFFDFLTPESKAKIDALSMADRLAAKGSIELELVRHDGSSAKTARATPSSPRSWASAAHSGSPSSRRG